MEILGGLSNASGLPRRWIGGKGGGRRGKWEEDGGNDEWEGMEDEEGGTEETCGGNNMKDLGGRCVWVLWMC